MRRGLAMLALCIALLGVICLPASAETAATRLDYLCTVNAEGDCLVSLTAVIQLDEAHNQMYFPIAESATDVQLGGNNATVTKGNSSTLVDISKLTRDYVGSLSLRISYTIPNVVKVDPELKEADGSRALMLTLPLLCSFDYPVQSMTFAITMPTGQMTHDPVFTSIYSQTSIMSSLTYEIRDSQIIGTSNTPLNDHEAITMTMQVPKEMFPTVSTYIREGNPELVPMAAFAVAALLYWLLFLRCLPIRALRTSTPPEGITAGELGCRLTLSGGDLTMMVFSWAQMGYLLIHLDGNGRVLLHKRMDMGNERSQFENRIFRALFGNRRVVDGTGDGYAQLCQQVWGMVPSERNMHKGSSGNKKIFRFLACISMVFCGICVAMNMSDVGILQTLMAIILGIFGAVSGWLIQAVGYRHHLRGKVPVLVGLVVILVWIVLGLLCGQVWIPLGCCAGELLMGYLAAYGGRRSDLGRHDAGMVLGLRRYLKRLPRGEINRLLNNDPDYFFNLAPYALAMGVIRPYSLAFGRRKLSQCPYLITPIHGNRTAEEWGTLMGDVADMLDYKERRMRFEKWFAVDVQLALPKKASRKRRRPGKNTQPPRKKRSEDEDE